MPSRMRFAGLAAVAVTMSLGFAGLSAPAWAEDAAPTTAAEATKIVEKLKAEQAELDRQYNEINTKVTELGDRADAQRAQVAATEKKVADIKSQLGAVALAEYQGRGANTTIGLLTSADSNNFLTRVGTVDQVTANQTVTLQSFQTEQANLEDLQRSLAASESQAQKELAHLKEVDDAARAKVTEAQKVADRLTAEEKAKFEAEKAAREKVEAENRAATETAATRPVANSTAEQRIAASTSTATQAPATNNAAAPAPAPAPEPAPSAGGLRSSSNAVGNRYSWGQCTWHVYNMRAAMGAPVGSFWGNAINWPGSAAAEGFPMGSTPRVGAVYVEYYAPAGHVSVVTSVSGGSFTISEMNWNGGVGVVHFRTVSMGAGGTFIY